jgi:hypothetical protein
MISAYQLILKPSGYEAFHREPAPAPPDSNPEDFQMCFKVWEEITIQTYAKHVRYGVLPGRQAI